jgi:hypothetical protein
MYVVAQIIQGLLLLLSKWIHLPRPKDELEELDWLEDTLLLP